MPITVKQLREALEGRSDDEQILIQGLNGDVEPAENIDYTTKGYYNGETKEMIAESDIEMANLLDIPDDEFGQGALISEIIAKAQKENIYYERGNQIIISAW